MIFDELRAISKISYYLNIAFFIMAIFVLIAGYMWTCFVFILISAILAGINEGFVEVEEWEDEE
jgi:hypothetical protein